ncbi:lysostaphin resistance A-like protein [Gemmatimonadota bacterium]
MNQAIYYPNIRQAIWLLILFAGFQAVLQVIVEGLNIPSKGHLSSGAVISLIAAGLIIKMYFKKTNAKFKDVFPLSPIKISLLLPMTLIILGANILLSELDNLTRSLLPAPEWLMANFHNLTTGQTSVWGSLALLVVSAPLTEEFLFRGLILSGFLGNYSVKKAVLASAVLFALIHLNPWQFLGGFIVGVLFAWWFIKTGSLLPCLFGHALINAMPMIVYKVLQLEIPGYSSGVSELLFQPLWFDSLGILLAGVGIWLLIRMFRRVETGCTAGLNEASAAGEP